MQKGQPLVWLSFRLINKLSVPTNNIIAVSSPTRAYKYFAAQLILCKDTNKYLKSQNKLH